MMEKHSADRSPEEGAPAGNEKSAAIEGGGGHNPKVGGGGRAEREVPPDDDVCPICFGDFTVPCKSVCGHWYCGGLLLLRPSF